MHEEKRMDANAREIHVIEFLAGLDAQLIEGQEHLKERLMAIPGGWRNFRLAVTTTERVLDALYETLPTKTLRHMTRLHECGEIVIRKKPLIPLPDDTQIVGNEDLKVLINSAVGNECAICVKERGEQRSCRLRGALKLIAPTAALNRDGSCEYRDVAAGNELGEYI